MESKIKEAIEILKSSNHTTAFTGAGISVESNIPPFRGEGGLWGKYDPKMLDINYFNAHPFESWSVIKEIFYDFFGDAKPNAAHLALAHMEKAGFLKAIITQNIDNLHQEAGSKTVFEYHGNSHNLICLSCSKKYKNNELSLDELPVRCTECDGLVKPDFIFFGEGIPQYPALKSQQEADMADVFIVIGSTGEVVPACLLPQSAKRRGAKIIEVNVKPSNYTHSITDVFLQGKATEMMDALANGLLT